MHRDRVCRIHFFRLGITNTKGIDERTYRQNSVCKIQIEKLFLTRGKTFDAQGALPRHSGAPDRMALYKPGIRYSRFTEEAQGPPDLGAGLAQRRRP